MNEQRAPSDPSTLTTAALTREIQALKELVDTRLDAMDKAMVLFNDGLTKAPTDTDKQINHLHDLIFERFKVIEQQFLSVQNQFEERDVRVKESALAATTAVNAALQAAKEAVGEQNKSFTLSIDKSEAATTKQIDALLQTVQTANSGLVQQMSDVKERVGRIENLGIGAATQKTEQHASTGTLMTVIGTMFGVVGVIAGAVIALAK